MKYTREKMPTEIATIIVKQARPFVVKYPTIEAPGSRAEVRCFLPILFVSYFSHALMSINEIID